MGLANHRHLAGQDILGLFGFTLENVQDADTLFGWHCGWGLRQAQRAASGGESALGGDHLLRPFRVEHHSGFEDWRYRYIDGIGTNVNIEFVDTTMSGEYRMTMDPSEKDALLYVPGAGLTMAEQARRRAQEVIGMAQWLMKRKTILRRSTAD